jgi:two-component system, NarL family, sensor kinase
MQARDNEITLLIIITTAIIFLLAAIIASLLYFYKKRQIAHQQNLHSLKLDFEKNLLKTQVEIQEQTFQHISREIHDNINLSLTLAKLNLVTLDWNDVERTRESINSSAIILGSTIADLNNLSKSINTEMIKELGLIKTIRNEIDRLKNMTQLQVNYEVTGETIFMDSEKELVIFRIIQEAFNNIIKHSKASNIWLDLNYNTDFLEVVIRDNGIGFKKDEISQKKENPHAGLNNMQTRARLFGGSFLLESQPQKGTQIFISIPYYS